MNNFDIKKWMHFFMDSQEYERSIERIKSLVSFIDIKNKVEIEIYEEGVLSSIKVLYGLLIGNRLIYSKSINKYAYRYLDSTYKKLLEEEVKKNLKEIIELNAMLHLSLENIVAIKDSENLYQKNYKDLYESGNIPYAKKFDALRQLLSTREKTKKNGSKDVVLEGIREIQEYTREINSNCVVSFGKIQMDRIVDFNLLAGFREVFHNKIINNCNDSMYKERLKYESDRLSFLIQLIRPKRYANEVFSRILDAYSHESGSYYTWIYDFFWFEKVALQEMCSSVNEMYEEALSEEKHRELIDYLTTQKLKAYGDKIPLVQSSDVQSQKILIKNLNFHVLSYSWIFGIPNVNFDEKMKFYIHSCFGDKIPNIDNLLFELLKKQKEIFNEVEKCGFTDAVIPKLKLTNSISDILKKASEKEGTENKKDYKNNKRTLISFKGITKNNIENFINEKLYVNDYMYRYLCDKSFEYDDRNKMPIEIFTYTLVLFLHNLVATNFEFPYKRIKVNKFVEEDTSKTYKIDINNTGDHCEEWRIAIKAVLNCFDNQSIGKKLNYSECIVGDGLGKLLFQHSKSELEELGKTIDLIEENLIKSKVKMREWRTIKKILKIQSGEIRNHILTKVCKEQIENLKGREIEALLSQNMDIITHYFIE